MRRSPWTLIFLLAAALLLLAVAQGCSSRRKSAPPAEVTPPPSSSESTQPAPEEPPPPPTTSGGEETQANLRDAFFDYDDASLREDAKAALEGNARYMESHGGAKVVIEGHCDERGSVEYNLALGEKRARAAKDYLTTYGINGSRITTISYGKERPFDTGHNEQAWAQNRRAHFVAK